MTWLFLILLPLILHQTCACSRSCDPLGETSPLTTLLPSDFPPLKFADVEDSEQHIRDEIQQAEDWNNKIGWLILDVDVITSFNIASAAVWTIIEKSFIKMSDIAQLEEKLFEQKIRNAIAASAIHVLAAQTSALKTQIERMLNPNLNLTERKAVLPTTQFWCETTLNLFSDTKYAFWTENMYTVPYLIDFALIHSTIVKFSAALDDPSYKPYYFGEQRKLINVLQKYREDVTVKRMEFLHTYPDGHIIPRYMDYADDLVKAFEYCWYTLYNKCPTSLGCEYEQRDWVVREGATTCVDGISTWQKMEWWRKRQFGRCYPYEWGWLMGVDPNIMTSNFDIYWTHDWITGKWVCGPKPECHGEYGDVVRIQIYNLFETTIDVAKRASPR